MKVSLNEATYPQLKEFCEINGIEVKVGHQATHLRSKITTVYPGTQDIEVSEASDVASDVEIRRGAMGVSQSIRKVEPTRAKLPPSHHKSDPTIEVRIPATKEPGGKREVEVAVNGLLFLVRRDEWVKVPYRVFEALNNAVETTYEDIPSQVPGSPPIRERYETQAYPFNYRNGPSDEELAAWQERMSAQPGQQEVREAA